MHIEKIKVPARQQNQDENFSKPALSASILPAVPVLQKEAIGKNHNQESLPDLLKSGVENISGLSMNDLKVHYNSRQPPDAQAFAQGNVIHTTPGQERQLPINAWHVIQPKQGLVKADLQQRETGNINAEDCLERNISLQHSPVQMSFGGTIQGFFPGKINNDMDLRTNIKGALDSGEKRINAENPLISKEENVNTLLPLIIDPAQKNVGSYADNFNFQKWTGNVLTRIEDGAESLSSDVEHWIISIRQQPHILEATPLNVELTGSELHDRGLGVSFLDIRYSENTSLQERMSVDFISQPKLIKERIRRVVLKPDDRSFEKAIIGKNAGSIAEQLNTKASLDKNSIETIGMQTSPDHGSIVEFVEENVVSYIGSWWKYLTGDKQPVIEAIGFAFLTGLWDLHSENVKDKGGKQFLIDAEVGFQPDIFKRQHTQGVTEIRNPGLEKRKGEDHKVIDNQLTGALNTGSNLIKWAKGNKKELLKILKNTIGDKSARIVPVFTADWFYFKERFLKYHFLNHPAYPGDTINEAVQSVIAGRPHTGSPGLNFQLGKNKLGETNRNLLSMEIEKDFMKGVIPEFNYQPNTGRVSFHGSVIWEGQNLDDSMSFLYDRL